MKKITFVFIFFLIFSGILFAQDIPADSLYFGQTPPDDSVITFATGIVLIGTEGRPD